MDNLRYPIGHFVPILNSTAEDRNILINQIPDISKSLRESLKHLSFEQIQMSYRPNGWTIQQVVHHMADNDMNAYHRLKRALTEDEPISDSYREDLWAELSDYKEAPIESSIILLESLHSRFYILLRSLGPENFNRRFRTQVLGLITIDIALQRFVWHNRHHISQIKSVTDTLR